MRERLSYFSIKAEAIERHLELLDMGWQGTENWNDEQRQAYDAERQMLVMRMRLNTKTIGELFNMLKV